MKAIGRSHFRVLRSCIAAGLLLAGVASTGALAADEQALSYEERAAAIQEEYELLSAEARRLSERATGQKGGFARILERRAEETGLQALAKANQLAELVIEREAAGQDPGAHRERASELLQSIHTGSRKYIEGLLNETDSTIETEAAELTPAEQAALEADRARMSARIMAILGALLRNLELSKELGVDASEQEQYLRTSLTDGAEMLSVSLELALEDRARLAGQIEVLPDDADLAAEARLTDARVDRIAANLATAVEMLDTLGIKAGDYKQQLIEVTGSVTTDIFDTDVIKGLIGRWFSNLGSWAVDSLPQFLFQVFLFLLVLWIAWSLSKLTRKLVTKALTAAKLRLSRLLRNMIISTAANLVLILGVLFGLAQIGISVGPLLAGLGIAGFIVGFALQDTLGNFASGMMILLYRPYDVGDLIEAGGVFGKVSHMSLVNTTVLTLDNQTLVMPNSKIWGDVIKNVTAQRVRRVDMVFGIGYGDDIPKAEKILTEIVASHEKVLDDPEPVVRVHTLNESSVDFIVRPWVETDDYWEVYWDITRAVKMRFDAEGVSIPFPQRDVHLFAGSDESIAAIVPARIEQGPVARTGTDPVEATDTGDTDGGDGGSS